MSSCVRFPTEEETRSTECAKHTNDSIGLEDVQKELGALGRYQILQLFCLSWCYLSYACVAFGFVFIGYAPEHTCLVVNETQLLEIYHLLNDSTATVSYDTCSTTVTSNRSGQENCVVTLGCYGGYNYRGGKYVSMVTEWDLVCDDIGKVEVVLSLFFVGNACGRFIWSSIGDRLGRRYTYIFTAIAAASMELGLLLSQNVATAMAFRFFSGSFVGGMVSIHYVMAQELFISKYRHAFAACDSLWWAMTITILSGCAFVLRNNEWRHLQLLTFSTFAPTLMFSIFVNDTPAWYFAKGRYEDAKRILLKACAMNKKNIHKIKMLYGQCVKHVHENRNMVVSNSHLRTREGVNYSPLDFLRHKRLFVSIIVLAFSWMTISLGYYGIFLTSSTLAGDRYLNFFLVTIVEFPAYILIYAFLFHIGRRIALITFYGITAVSYLVSTCLSAFGQDHSASFGVSTAFFILSKFSVSVSFTSLFLYTPELFPTTMRATALGICLFSAVIANVFSPYLLVLFKIVAWGPGAINVLLLLVCAILLMLLPETKGRQLTSTIEGVLGWQERKSVVNC